MNFIFLTPLALYIVWTDGVRLSRLGDFVGLTPLFSRDTGIRMNAPQNSIYWFQKKSSASAFSLLEKRSVGTISQKSSLKSHYDVRVVNPGPEKDVFMLDCLLVGFPIPQKRGFREVLGILTHFQRLWSPSARDAIKETELEAVQVWTVFCSCDSFPPTPPPPPPPPPPFSPCLASVWGFNSECLKGDVMIFLLGNLEPLEKWVDLAGWTSIGPSGQKPVLPSQGWVTTFMHKNKPVRDKKWVMKLTHI